MTSTPAHTLVKPYCISCHNQKTKTANLALDTADADQIANSAETWEKVIVQLRSRSMPPARSRRPDNTTYDSVATWLETELDRSAAAHPNPGRSASLHRLNRTDTPMPSEIYSASRSMALRCSLLTNRYTASTT